MNFKLALIATTALGLLTGVTWADSNVTYLLQNGVGNSASVSQSGTQSRAGTSGDPLKQTGNYNVIIITQTSPGGAPSGHNRSRSSVGEEQRGVDQIGNNNKLQIIQLTTTTNWPTSVTEVQQTANGVTGSEITNDLYVNQNDPSGRNSRIYKVRQTYTGGDGTVAADRNKVTIDQTGGWQGVGVANTSSGGIFQTGVGNTVDIDQAGSSNDINKVSQTGKYNSATLNQNGASNVITAVISTGDNNVTNISQVGNNNVLTSLTQTGLSGGLGNVASLSFLGNSNGTGGFSGAAGTVGLGLATVLQQGDANALTYNVTGSGNLFAFSQLGDTNRTTGTVSGNNNQVAVLQNGNANTVLMTQSGDSNNLAVLQ